jgi:hypothetical protein
MRITMRITMERLAYWVIAAISISAVNLVLLVWVIVPPFLFPVSVNSKNETTDRPSIHISGGNSASGDIDDLRREIDDHRREIDELLRAIKILRGDAKDAIDELRDDVYKNAREIQYQSHRIP